MGKLPLSHRGQTDVHGNKVHFKKKTTDGTKKPSTPGTQSSPRFAEKADACNNIAATSVGVNIQLEDESDDKDFLSPLIGCLKHKDVITPLPTSRATTVDPDAANNEDTPALTTLMLVHLLLNS